MARVNRISERKNGDECRDSEQSMAKGYALNRRRGVSGEVGEQRAHKLSSRPEAEHDACCRCPPQRPQRPSLDFIDEQLLKFTDAFRGCISDFFDYFYRFALALSGELIGTSRHSLEAIFHDGVS
ncbi:hypothetical protein [Bosea sp. NBC_00550]|uniref:hypothetical protein n=1 Tax=Bosea sp. NBC_00550 TaxID=2969621 RepID=UPI00223012DC|nr:hypothetical protein [Bosea sp. NBC_00550]UZF90416.1 hypothetical protein NWE53_14790 [Bosea sp. NBC_00550]